MTHHDGFTPGTPAPDAEQARALLNQAEQTAATARAGAAGTTIALQMVMGAGSSLSLIAMWLAGRELLILPLLLFFAWLAFALVLNYRFGHAAKRGFSQRWLIFIGVWAILWIIATFLTADGAIGDNVWFVTVMALALSAVPAAGAWIEAAA